MEDSIFPSFSRLFLDEEAVLGGGGARRVLHTFYAVAGQVQAQGPRTKRNDGRPLGQWWGAITGQQRHRGFAHFMLSLPRSLLMLQTGTVLGWIGRELLVSCVLVIRSVPRAIPGFSFLMHFLLPSSEVPQASEGRESDLLALLC